MAVNAKLVDTEVNSDGSKLKRYEIEGTGFSVTEEVSSAKEESGFVNYISGDEELTKLMEEERKVKEQYSVELSRLQEEFSTREKSPIELLGLAVDSKIGLISTLGKFLMGYDKKWSLTYRDMDGKVHVKEKANNAALAQDNLEFYNLIINVVNQNDDLMFNVGMYAITMAFLAHTSKDSAYDAINLGRAATSWNNEKNAVTFSILVQYIRNITYRILNIKHALSGSISLSVGNERLKGELSNDTITKIVGFYQRNYNVGGDE